MTLPVQVVPNLSRSYAPWLWFLLSLFTVRVIAQPSALLFDVGFLPPFASWHGGVLPYPILLVMQLFILGWLVRTARQFTRGSVTPRYRLGMAVLIMASMYFIAMLLRLVLGLTILGEHRWFTSYLPAFFHLVLASFLLLYGHFHFRYG